MIPALHTMECGIYHNHLPNKMLCKQNIVCNSGYRRGAPFLSGSLVLYLGGTYIYIDVIMSMMASQITRSRLFTQLFVQAQIKENMKALRHWPLWGEFISDQCEFPAQRASNMENGHYEKYVNDCHLVAVSYSSVLPISFRVTSQTLVPVKQPWRIWMKRLYGSNLN